MSSTIHHGSLGPAQGKALPFSRGLYGRELQALVHAVLTSSFSGGSKTGHVVLVQDPDILRRIGQLLPDIGPAHDVAHAILVCGVCPKDRPLGPLVADCYDATTNLLHAAHLRALRPLTASFFPDRAAMQAVRKLLSIPEDVLPFSITVLRRRLVKAPEELLAAPNVHHDTWE